MTFVKNNLNKLVSWAENSQEAASKLFIQSQPRAHRSRKKLYWYSRLGCIEVTEQLSTREKEKEIVLSFSEQAGDHCRGCEL